MKTLLNLNEIQSVAGGCNGAVHLEGGQKCHEKKRGKHADIYLDEPGVIDVYCHGKPVCRVRGDSQLCTCDSDMTIVCVAGSESKDHCRGKIDWH